MNPGSAVQDNAVMGVLDRDFPSTSPQFDAKVLERSGGDIMMEYKGYIGNVEIDDEANIFHGEVINLGDVVTFQGATVTQRHKAFRASVDDYLEFCSERGESPEKPFSGKFMVRVEPELHKAVAMHAKVEHKSLNAWVHDALALAAK